MPVNSLDLPNPGSIAIAREWYGCCQENDSSGIKDGGSELAEKRRKIKGLETMAQSLAWEQPVARE